MNAPSHGRGRMLRIARRVGLLGTLAVLTAAGAATLLGSGAVAVVRAALVRPPEPGARDAGAKERAEKYAASFGNWLAQIRGRSMFFQPPRPSPPPPLESRERGPEPDPRPMNYAGPAMIAMVNDSVWFEDGKRLVLGEEEGADLAVVSINPPWSARLRWNGVEFEVPLFSRTTPQFLVPDEGSEPAPDGPITSTSADSESPPPPGREHDQKEPE